MSLSLVVWFVGLSILCGLTSLAMSSEWKRRVGGDGSGKGNP